MLGLSILIDAYIWSFCSNIRMHTDQPLIFGTCTVAFILHQSLTMKPWIQKFVQCTCKHHCLTMTTHHCFMKRILLVLSYCLMQNTCSHDSHRSQRITLSSLETSSLHVTHFLYMVGNFFLYFGTFPTSHLCQILVGFLQL